MQNTLSKNDTQSFFSAECHFDMLYKYSVFKIFVLVSVADVFFAEYPLEKRYSIVFLSWICSTLGQFRLLNFVLTGSMSSLSGLPSVRKSARQSATLTCYINIQFSTYFTALKNSSEISCEYFDFSLADIKSLFSPSFVSATDIIPETSPIGNLLIFALNLTYGTLAP